MPSKAPEARSAWWAVIIPVAIVLLGALWAYLSVLSDDVPSAPPGVVPVAPAAPAVPATAEPEPEPEESPNERVPPRSTPPSPEEIPTPDDFEPR